MEYTVLEWDELATLIRKVNEHLKDGWKCQGGIAITRIYSGGVWYAQAMIKE
jgi:hypothetical protein